MMTQQLPPGILAAPLAEIDRRGLSQAWYSALHLAQKHDAPPRQRPQRACPGAPARTIKSELGVARPHRQQPTVIPFRRPKVSVVPDGREVARRPMHSRLARQIESIILAPPAPSKRSTFIVDGKGARVHVMLQTKGVRVTLVAMCRPEQREVVARALAQARFALAARGMSATMLRWEV
jgi:hypothetical protein